MESKFKSRLEVSLAAKLARRSFSFATSIRSASAAASATAKSASAAVPKTSETFSFASGGTSWVTSFTFLNATGVGVGVGVGVGSVGVSSRFGVCVSGVTDLSVTTFVTATFSVANAPMSFATRSRCFSNAKSLRKLRALPGAGASAGVAFGGSPLVSPARVSSVCVSGVTDRTGVTVEAVLFCASYT